MFLEDPFFCILCNDGALNLRLHVVALPVSVTMLCCEQPRQCNISTCKNLTSYFKSCKNSHNFFIRTTFSFALRFHILVFWTIFLLLALCYFYLEDKKVPVIAMQIWWQRKWILVVFRYKSVENSPLVFLVKQWKLPPLFFRILIASVANSYRR